MALINSIEFTQHANDISLGTLLDASDYGVGGNPARSETANYINWSKTDQNGNRTYDDPDPGQVLITISYEVNTPSDGWYEAIRHRIWPYDPTASYVEEQSLNGVITQYASVFFYATTNRTYKAIAPSTGADPQDTSLFIAVNDFSTLIGNTNTETYIQNVYVKTRSEQCSSAKFANACGCGCNGDSDKMKSALRVRYQIIAADTEYVNGNPEAMEKIIREVEETCPNC